MPTRGLMIAGGLAAALALGACDDGAEDQMGAAPMDDATEEQIDQTAETMEERGEALQEQGREETGEAMEEQGEQMQ